MDRAGRAVGVAVGDTTAGGGVRVPVRAVALGLLILVGVQACGVLPYSGPPDDGGLYNTDSHGRP